MKTTKSIPVHIAFIPFEDKNGYTAFYAEIPQVAVEVANKEDAINKLNAAISDLPDLIEALNEPDFEVTEETLELVA